jgi:chemotaxis response regulator CheB
MPVQAVKDGMPVETNHVYVIPLGTTMTLKNKLLKLNSTGKSVKPIDVFFVSLDENLKNRSM